MKGYIPIDERRGYFTNEGLKSKYDEMHSKSSLAWFSDGKEERELILKMGEPWPDTIFYSVLEIGCGEGDLGRMIINKTCKKYRGIDYSEKAIKKAKEKYPQVTYEIYNYRNLDSPRIPVDRLIMQGLLEHLDDPFTELKWMMDNLLNEKGDVITSSPCFLNPRGIVWMTLDMLGAIMSKTDLHFLNPWEFGEFAKQNDYQIKIEFCDLSWGNSEKMIKDFRERIPLALKDGNINFDQKKVDKFLNWLFCIPAYGSGATAVYKISK